MNRALRTASVTLSAVAGGTVMAAAVLLPASPASADGAGAGAVADRTASPGAARRTGRAADRNSVRGPGTVGAPTESSGGLVDTTRTGRGPGTVPADDTKPDPRPLPCHRWPYWPPWPQPPAAETGNRNALFMGVALPVPVAPPVAALSTPSRPPVSLPEAVPAAAGAAAVAVPESGPAPARGAVNNGAPRSSALPLLLPSAPPASGATIPPRAPVHPPAAAPSSMLPRAEEVAVAIREALPGLIGLAILTMAGGLLGYRQAKAGFALRAAGTARFLR